MRVLRCGSEIFVAGAGNREVARRDGGSEGVPKTEQSRGVELTLYSAENRNRHAKDSI